METDSKHMPTIANGALTVPHPLYWYHVVSVQTAELDEAKEEGWSPHHLQRRPQRP